MTRALSAELSLAAACCRWPVDAGRQHAIVDRAGRSFDWERFEGIVSRNRVGSLVHHALGQTGISPSEPVAERLSRHAQSAARRSLQMTRESLRLQRAFEAQGLPLLVVKGAPLAILAYGELGLKESSDIDLLVSPDAVPTAKRLLGELGYESELDHLAPRQFGEVVRHSKELAFVHRESRILTELHWDLVDNRRLLRGVGVDGPTQVVGVKGGALRTLAVEELFAYLCVHGGAHNWARLKWLADVGAFVGRRSPAEIEQLFASATHYGAGRPASVALMLCGQLFGLEWPDTLARTIQRDGIARALVANTLAGLEFRGGTVEHRRYVTPKLRAMAAQFLLVPGASHAFEQVRVMWNSPTDRALVQLPGRLGVLYHVLRVPLWLVRAGGRAWDRLRA
jgi:hypothetical protein